MMFDPEPPRFPDPSSDEDSPRPGAPDGPPPHPPAPPAWGGIIDAGASTSHGPAADPSDPACLSPPDFLGMAVSASRAMARFAASGFRRVDPDTHASRLHCCQDCRFRDAKRCRLCGCFIDPKAWLPHEDCPVGKWTV
jgi:hypothetical protein